ncbi:hypothetical protein ACFMPD_11720 [Sedimentitalea sp. HM32M-2]|uniref:hypothetical protein n=1 Tax=Sedimentitalea sp. HM32M-2 TaxID=3351566 RepID=UPI00363D79A2
MTSEPDITPDRRLIVHCGLQKTGSTSLHHFVGRNRAALAGRMAVLTPEKGSLTRELGRAAVRFSLNPASRQREALADLARQMSARIKGSAPTVLISHENLLGAMLGNGPTVTLYPQLEAIIAILGETFAPLQPEFVVYTRDMSDWKHSVYGQAVRSDRYAKSRAAFLQETADCGDWTDLYKRFVAQVGSGSVRFFRLEDEADPRRPAQQLLRSAGLSNDEIAALSPVQGRSNPGLNAGALEFMWRLNGLGLDRPVRRRIADLVVAQQSLFVSEPA